MRRRAGTAFALALACACAACGTRGTGGPGATAGPGSPGPRTEAAWDGLPPDTACDADDVHRCVPFAEALDWWGVKPALVPADAKGSRALLSLGYDAGTSEEPGYGPYFAYVLPDRLFPAMTRLHGGDEEAAKAGGVVVRTTYAAESLLPRSSHPGARTVRVRGHDALLTERPASGGGPALREVAWHVRYLDDHVLWQVTDSTGSRSERELLALVESLAEHRAGS